MYVSSFKGVGDGNCLKWWWNYCASPIIPFKDYCLHIIIKIASRYGCLQTQGNKSFKLKGPIGSPHVSFLELGTLDFWQSLLPKGFLSWSPTKKAVEVTHLRWHSCYPSKPPALRFSLGLAYSSYTSSPHHHVGKPKLPHFKWHLVSSTLVSFQHTKWDTLEDPHSNQLFSS